MNKLTGACLTVVVGWILVLVLGTTLVHIAGPYLFPDHYNWSWSQEFVFLIAARTLVASNTTSVVSK